MAFNDSVTEIQELNIHHLSFEAYEDLMNKGQIDPNALYMVTGDDIKFDEVLNNTSENAPQTRIVYAALGNKVDKVSGKGLSTNDYTTTEKNKLSGIAANANNYTHPSHTAQSNGFYKVTVNNLGHVTGVSAVVKDDITKLGIPASAPTKVSELTNDSNYITTSHSNNGDIHITASERSTWNGKASTATATSTSSTTAQMSPYIQGPLLPTSLP